MKTSRPSETGVYDLPGCPLLFNATHPRLGIDAQGGSQVAGVRSGRSTSRMVNSPTCQRCLRMWTSSAHIRPSARSSPPRCTRSLRCTHTPFPPSGSPSHPHARKSPTPETGGRTEQRSVSGSSSMGESIRSRDQDKRLAPRRA